MTFPVAVPDWVQINCAVEAFEAACERNPAVDLAGYLPPRPHPLYLRILTELVRVDMERMALTHPVEVCAYLRRFPELETDPQALKDLAFEARRQQIAEAEDDHGPSEPPPVAGGNQEPDFPVPGQVVQGFELLTELGRGAFSRVFLARQQELAARQVVVKVARGPVGEPQVLARLQHTHIVPIYSAQRWGPFEVLCLPYFGATTLQHLLQILQPDAPLRVADTLFTTVRGQADTVRERFPPAPTPAVRAPTPSRSEAVQRLLQGRSHAEAILKLGIGIARGLEHAHERGILHLDLKPANVLLTDEGQPMLLDFNLARTLSTADPHIGGTWPYMAPEQRRAFAGAEVPLDGRTDLYAVGVLLYQLLTGQLPPGAAEREPVPPQPLAWPENVSPAVRAIVSHCLEGEPARRYQTATQLAEDLERQSQSLPLRHQADPSLGERLQKWLRRHPLALSGSSVTLMVVLLLGLLGLTTWQYRRAAARFEAEANLRQFRADLDQVRFLLHAPRPDQEQLRHGLALCARNLDRYQAQTQDPSLALLPELDRDEVRAALGEQLYLLVRSSREMAERSGAGEPPPLEQWRTWLQRARTCYGSERVPRVVLELAAELAHLSGDLPESRELRRRLSQCNATQPEDLYLAGSKHLSRGEYRAAVPLLEQLVQESPQHLWGWIALGYCHSGLGAPQQAVACYDTAVALRPDAAWSRYLRGLARLQARQGREAATDFTAALERAPHWSEPRLARALAWQQLQRWEQAQTDLTGVMEREGASPRLLLLRARVKQQAGDGRGAEQDRTAGLQQLPTEELGWVARGLVHLEQSPALALNDLEQALRCNPVSQSALQNKAHVLAERLARPGDALPVLNRLVTLYPEYLPGRAGRAVVLARLEQRTAAHREAQECLRRRPHREILFQLGSVYALTSRQHPTDVERALELLRTALGQGYGRDQLLRDPDLAPLRSHPEFVQLVAESGPDSRSSILR